MADISSSAAKQHVLGGAEGDVKRMSGDAVQVARELGHSYLNQLGRIAAENAAKDRRKTIMPPDLHAAANSLRGSSSVESAPASAPVSEGSTY